LNNLKYFFILYICLITSSQAEITLRQYNDRYCYDGDTCYVTVDGTNTKIRLLELDTPEISKPKCEQELEWGLRARDFINNRIENAQTIEFKTNYELDWFGRTLSYLIIDGEDISAELVRNNLGVVYKKGFKVDWCQEHVN
jgi:endonuclease YncB( thermonuclease family)